MSKILLVEDDETLSRMYQKKLVLEGFEVVAAFAGDEGLKMASIEKPDLILMDVMMPNMDGFEVIKELQTKEETKGIPVIILTNLGTSEIFVDKARMLGVKNYLIKYKTSAGEVVQKIREELGER